jgi:hypothetical protein
MYTEINFKSKKELKQSVSEGKQIGVYSPGPFPCPDNGEICIEGPHYPKPHTWYARVKVCNGIIVKVIS